MNPLVLTILCAACVLIITAVGALRDVRRGILALAGTLLGANVVYIWSGRLINYTSTTFKDNNSQAWALGLHLLGFGSTLLVVGYGCSLLFSQSKTITIRERAITALLGLVNGLLVVGYSLQFAVRANYSLSEIINNQTPTRLLFTGLPYVLLAVPVVLAVLLVTRGLLALHHRAPVPAKPAQAKPAAPAPAKPAAAPAPAPAKPATPPASASSTPPNQPRP